MTAQTVTVQPGSSASYDIVVGGGSRFGIAAAVRPATRTALIHTASVHDFVGELVSCLKDDGIDVHLITVAEGESAKSLDVAASCWDELGALGFTRDDVIVGVGGGAVTDLAGFVAATWLRGIRVIHIPTTVLAMVDAGIGGKTGLNTSAGKNLIGAFHHPSAVLCDTDSLATLPDDEVVSGLAEVVKAGFIADPSILDLIESDPQAATARGPLLVELILRSIRVKAEVVSSDPTEQGRREILNYGHTFGHAIERAEGYRWRHGEAVSVGMCFVAQLSGLLGRLDRPTIDRHSTILTAIGLPTTYRGDRWDVLAAGMRVDKKNRGHHRRFIVLDALARPVALDDPDLESLQAAYERVSA